MGRSYACGMLIASTKTSRMGAWSSLPVGWGPSCKKAGVHDHPLTARNPHVQASVPNSRHRAVAVPAGAYEVITDEETIEALTFSAYRRIASMIMVPGAGGRDSIEMLSIGSVDLANAQVADASAAND
jgi:hypothetical protein